MLKHFEKYSSIIFLSLALCLFTYNGYSQVGIGTLDPEASSVLDVRSTSKGFLPPRMTKAQRDLINSPAEGLVVYNTDENCLNFHNGSNWVSICNSGNTPPPPLPANITLVGGQTAYIASVYDKDYLPYTAPTDTAKLGSANVNGVLEPTVDVQGVLNTTTGTKVLIPYTVVNGDVDLDAYSQTRTIITDFVQGSVSESNDGGGTPVDVNLSYDAVTLSIGSGFIEATLKAVGSDFNAVKLDINNGIGTDLGILLAEFTISTNAAGDLDTIFYRDIAGIPDRQFGQASADGDLQEHDFLYLPVEAEDGKIWLNHNLGANYTNIHNNDFNIAATPTSAEDRHAFGSLFQWGRQADGHELRSHVYNGTSWSSGYVNAPSNPRDLTTSAVVDQGANYLTNIRLPFTVDRFNKGNPSQDPSESAAIAQFNWQFPTRHNDQWLPTANGGDANPCPEGFRVPTEAEWNAWDAVVAPNINDPVTNATNSDLRLTFASSTGHSAYWSTTFHSRTVSQVNPYGSSSTPAGYQIRVSANTTHGDYHANVARRASLTWMSSLYPVRCIQSSASTSPIPSSMNIITDDQIKYIASINDNDYLPFSIPTTEANQQVSGDGSADDNLIDIQGILTTTGQTFSIPYTSTGSPSYPGYEWTVEVHDSLTEDSQGRTVSFSYPGATATNTGEIIVTVKAIGGNLNLKRLDLANGLGNGTSTNGNIPSAYGILIAEAPITIDDMGTVKYFQLRNISGIPDRRFGEQTTQGGTLGFYHNNLYLPTIAEDGRTWLNHQLGAIYTRTLNYDGNANTDFDPAATPTSLTDYKAYGNYFQWGRYSDGHELLTFKLSPTGGGYLTSGSGVYYDEVNSTKNTKETTTDKTLTSNQFVIVPSGSWHNSPTTSEILWTGETAPNNPCPQGFRVPKHSEYQNLRSSINWTSIGGSPTLSEKNNYFAGLQIKWVFSGNRGVNSYFFGDYHTTTNGYIFAGTSDQSSSNIGAVSHIYINPNGYWPAISPNSPQNNKGSGYTIRCIQHIEEPAPIPANMTVEGDKISYLASVLDQDYIPYTVPTGPAKQGAKSADNTDEDTGIDLQGVLTTSGQTLSIPFTVTGSVSYDAYSYTVSVHDSLTEDGMGRDVNFSYPSGSPSTNGSIVMTIKSIGGDLNLKKLDINNGIGDGTSIEGHLNSGVFGVLVAEVPILINSSNDTNYIQLRNVAGIPDRRFGEQTKTGSTNLTNGTLGYNHNNMYLPVEDADGNIWLNNNLGADYSDLNHPSFNPNQQANTYQDEHAYGSQFQWGRYADGHELVNYTSSSVGVGLNQTTTTLSPTDIAGHNLFIESFTDWRDNPNPGAWNGEAGISNPCPHGFKVPSSQEFNEFKNSTNPIIGNHLDAHNSVLKLTSPGQRGESGSILSEGHYSAMFLWSSSVNNANTDQAIHIQASNNLFSVINPHTKVIGHAVRCIQHINEPALIPLNMTLEGDKAMYIASVGDMDYSPYIASNRPAQLSAKPADNSDETTGIDIQGVLTTTGQTIHIPYTVTGTVTYDPYSYTVTIPDSLTEDGMGGTINFSYPGGSTSTDGSIVMTIKSIGGDINLKKLDINNGIGDGTSIDGSLTTGVFGVLVAEVPIYIDNSKTINHIQIRNVAGIPDRRYGETSTQGGQSGNYHNNLYLPILAEDGKIWLNNNLGANYASTTHDEFNFVTQGQNTSDEDAYGSLFQWGRYSDGHELINWTSSNSGTPINTGTEPNRSPTYRVTGHSKFISGNVGGQFDWVNSSGTNLWTGTNLNNPCPVGFTIPTQSDYQTLFVSVTISNANTAYSATDLKFTTNGQRQAGTGGFHNPGINSRMWMSTLSPNLLAARNFLASNDGSGSFHFPDSADRGLAAGVRCIQE